MDVTTISIVINVITVLICVLTFFNSKNKDTKTETASDSYKWGRLEEKLSNVENQMNKVLDKLDFYDLEIENKVKRAITEHESKFHK